MSVVILIVVSCALYYWLDNRTIRDPFRIVLLSLVLLGLSAQPAVAQQRQPLIINTLDCANCQRDKFDLPPWKADPQLQRAAEWAAYQRSLRGMKGHLHINMQGQRCKVVAGRWEGTAKRSSRQRGRAGEPWGPEDVYACYQNHSSATYAGVASVLGPDGYWYYQINLR